MGAMITQRPTCSAPWSARCHCSTCCTIRISRSPSSDPRVRQRRKSRAVQVALRLLAYHHVKPGAEYPAILFMTADNDTASIPCTPKRWPL